jgi:intracellular sulfur oxidation DsrE/DsrF family protein
MTAADTIKAHGQRMVAEIDERELAIRMCEAASATDRIAGQTLDETFATVPKGFVRAARAAMEYWAECIQKMQQPN